MHLVQCFKKVPNLAKSLIFPVLNPAFSWKDSCKRKACYSRQNWRGDTGGVSLVTVNTRVAPSGPSYMGLSDSLSFIKSGMWIELKRPEKMDSKARDKGVDRLYNNFKFVLIMGHMYID